jgi:predicted hydrocarbon binding protein
MNVSESPGGAPQNQHKFKNDSGFTYEQVFNFAFGNWYIPYMKGMQAEIGKEIFLELLKRVGNNFYRNSVKPRFGRIKNKNVRSLIENFWEPTQNSKLWGTSLTIKIPEKKDTQGKVKITECLVAATFRENDAGEIGYAAICDADFAVANAFNPKIKMTRNKCLMKGHGCCLFEYTMKA